MSVLKSSHKPSISGTQGKKQFIVGGGENEGFPGEILNCQELILSC